MDIICDTNIWYNIGNGSIDVSGLSVSDRLIANYNNIDEFATTTNHISIPDHTRKAIQALYRYSKDHIIVDPPLVHIIKLNDPSFQIDLSDHIDPMLDFTRMIGQGDIIDSLKTDVFKELSEARRQKLEAAANEINSQAETIRKAIKNRKLKKRMDRIPSIREMISSYVSVQTGGKHLPDNYDWTKIELFENVILDFYITLERGANKITANDWYDLFLLAFVQPGQKVWTKENKWLKIIADSGMSKYLFDK